MLEKYGNEIFLKYSLQIDLLFSLPIVQMGARMSLSLGEEVSHQLQVGLEG
jgi:hypothetical protein